MSQRPALPPKPSPYDLLPQALKEWLPKVRIFHCKLMVMITSLRAYIVSDTAEDRQEKRAALTECLETMDEISVEVDKFINKTEQGEDPRTLMEFLDEARVRFRSTNLKLRALLIEDINKAHEEKAAHVEDVS